MATVDVQSEIAVARPREVVAAYVANPDNAPGVVCEHQIGRMAD